MKEFRFEHVDWFDIVIECEDRATAVKIYNRMRKNDYKIKEQYYV